MYSVFFAFFVMPQQEGGLEACFQLRTTPYRGHSNSSQNVPFFDSQTEDVVGVPDQILLISQQGQPVLP